MPEWSKYQERVVEVLQKLLADASSEAVRVCRAWHGETFGTPGYGSISFVAGELTKAQVAVNELALTFKELADRNKAAGGCGCAPGTILCPH